MQGSPVAGRPRLTNLGSQPRLGVIPGAHPSGATVGCRADLALTLTAPLIRRLSSVRAERADQTSGSAAPPRPAPPGPHPAHTRPNASGHVQASEFHKKARCFWTVFTLSLDVSLNNHFLSHVVLKCAALVASHNILKMSSNIADANYHRPKI